jgi:hypothetical protein
MQISTGTIAILKNFAQINTNILVREGSELRTISTMKDIFAKATVEETFPTEFAIYDLTSLLALLTLTENQEIEFGDKSLKISKDSGEFEYFYADPSIIVAPPQKNIVVDEHFTFNLSKEDMVMITKAAAIVSAPAITFESKNGKVILSVGDPKTPASNSYKKQIGTFDKNFNVQLAVGNLKVIPDAYEVVLSQKKFVHFRNVERQLFYWLAAEPKSVI